MYRASVAFIRSQLIVMWKWVLGSSRVKAVEHVYEFQRDGKTMTSQLRLDHAGHTAHDEPFLHITLQVLFFSENRKILQ